MLYPRIIPSLLIKDKGLVKSIKFKNYKYVGDPLNAVKIFNEKKADEIIVLDIDASVKKLEPNYDLIGKISNECKMPLCYGGGIKSLVQAEKILSLGVEKIAISSLAFEQPNIVDSFSKSLGTQSVCLVIDVKKKVFFNDYEIYIHNGSINTGENLFKYLEKINSSSFGEIVINCIDNDGMMEGYNIELIKKIRTLVKMPLTILGGAGSLEDIRDIIKLNKLVGAAAGSLFVFKGPLKAVLINYPKGSKKEDLYV
tara:strand:+ start:589 stop:1353 length:765 start_codon:yes stop_codon:yes gene_type:complete